MRVRLNGGTCWHGDYVRGLRLLPLAPAVLYCALLRPLLFIAEQVCIALEHAGGFVSGDLHAILHRTAGFPRLVCGAPPKVVEDFADVLRILAPRLSTRRAFLADIQLGGVVALSITAITAVVGTP